MKLFKKSDALFSLSDLTRKITLIVDKDDRKTPELYIIDYRRNKDRPSVSDVMGRESLRL